MSREDGLTPDGRPRSTNFLPILRENVTDPALLPHVNCAWGFSYEQDEVVLDQCQVLYCDGHNGPVTNHVGTCDSCVNDSYSSSGVPGDPDFVQKKYGEMKKVFWVYPTIFQYQHRDLAVTASFFQGVGA
jgi:hypothetical protein